MRGQKTNWRKEGARKRWRKISNDRILVLTAWFRHLSNLQFPFLCFWKSKLQASHWWLFKPTFTPRKINQDNVYAQLPTRFKPTTSRLWGENSTAVLQPLPIFLKHLLGLILLKNSQAQTSNELSMANSSKKHRSIFCVQVSRDLDQKTNQEMTSFCQFVSQGQN